MQLVWQFDAFGIGNLARIKEQRGGQSETFVELYKTQDKVAAEVTEAHANLQSAAARVSQADRSLRTAIIAYNGNVEGLRHTTRFGDVLVLIYRPQEVVYALRLLKLAFDEYFTTVADYNRAEFELFHALGYPAQEITYLRPPGKHRAGRHGATGISAAGGQRSAAGDPLNRSPARLMCFWPLICSVDRMPEINRHARWALAARASITELITWHQDFLS